MGARRLFLCLFFHQCYNGFTYKALVEMMNINKELLIQALELYLQDKHLDGESLNTIAEYAPLIYTELAKAYGMNIGEFRQYINNQNHIELNTLRRVILGTALSPINPKTGQPYFYNSKDLGLEQKAADCIKAKNS